MELKHEQTSHMPHVGTCVISQYLLGKEERAAVREHYHQSHHPSVFAGFYLLEGKVYGGYKTPPRAKRQSTYGRLEAVCGTVHHAYKWLPKIEILFPAASAFCGKNVQFL